MLKPATRPETRQTRQLQLHRAYLTVNMKVKNNIATQMTLRPRGIGRPTARGRSGNRSVARVVAVPKANRVSRGPEERAFSPDTLAPAEVGPVPLLHLSLRLAQGVPLPPHQHHHARRRLHANGGVLLVLRHLLLPLPLSLVPRHVLLVLLVPFPICLLLLLLRMLLLPAVGRRLCERLRGLRDHRRGPAVPRLRRRGGQIQEEMLRRGLGATIRRRREGQVLQLASRVLILGKAGKATM